MAHRGGIREITQKWGKRFLWEGQIGVLRKANDFLGELRGNNKACANVCLCRYTWSFFFMAMTFPGEKDL